MALLPAATAAACQLQEETVTHRKCVRGRPMRSNTTLGNGSVINDDGQTDNTFLFLKAKCWSALIRWDKGTAVNYLIVKDGFLKLGEGGLKENP